MTPAKALARTHFGRPQCQFIVLHRATRPGLLRRWVNSITRMAMLMRSPGPSFRWEMARRRVIRERALVVNAGNCTRSRQAAIGQAIFEEEIRATASFWL